MTRALSAPSACLSELGVAKLHALCEALGYEAGQTQEMAAIFRLLASSWGDRPVDAPPLWASDITDDHTPYEFSVAVDGGLPEIRFLLEVQGQPPSIAANWDAARAMNARLGAELDVELGRLAAIEDLFAPTPACRRFSLWHAVCFPRGGAPKFKAYLNPQVRGWAEAYDLTRAALARLGLGGAELPPATAQDEICYFSLDLSRERGARVKVYTAHYNGTGAQIDAAVAGAKGYVPEQAAEFCQTMADAPGPYQSRPVLTCLSFIEGDNRPATATIHFPLRSYAPNDAAARARVLSYIHAEGASVYDRALEAFAHRRLDDGVGMQTYVSLRQERGHRRLTVYLAPEVYDVGQSPMTQPKVSGVIERLQEQRGWFSAVGDENA